MKYLFGVVLLLAASACSAESWDVSNDNESAFNIGDGVSVAVYVKGSTKGFIAWTSEIEDCTPLEVYDDGVAMVGKQRVSTKGVVIKGMCFNMPATEAGNAFVIDEFKKSNPVLIDDISYSSDGFNKVLDTLNIEVTIL